MISDLLESLAIYSFPSQNTCQLVVGVKTTRCTDRTPLHGGFKMLERHVEVGCAGSQLQDSSNLVETCIQSIVYP